METHNPTKTTAVTTIIHFVPNGPIDAAAKKSIRSHVTLDVRRKQRQQKLLSLQAKPSKPRGAFFEDNLCRCYVSGSTVHNISPGKPSKSRSAIQRQQIADSYKICSKCRGTQFRSLSGEGQLRAARTHPAIVALLQTGLDPFNSMPEVPDLSPIGVQLLHDIKTFMVTFSTPGDLKTIFFPAANETPAMLMGFLYLSCWNLAALRDDQDVNLAKVGTLIKKEAIRQINIRLSDPKTAYTSSTISAIGWISAGVMCLGEDTALEEAHTHEEGLLSLMHQGPRWNPDDPLGQGLLHLLVLHEFAQAVMSNRPIPEPILLKYGQNYPPISKTDIVAESPVFRPLDDFYCIRDSKQCSEKVIELLHAIADFIDATLLLDPLLGFSNTLALDQYDRAKARLEPFQLVQCTMHTDYVYECCRLTSIIMVHAIDSGNSFSEVDTSVLEQLKSALKMTDIGNYWGKLCGVLYWVSLVGAAAATIGKPQHGYIDTVYRLVINYLVYRSPVYEAMTIGTAKLVKIKGLLGTPTRIREACLKESDTSPKTTKQGESL